MRKVPFVFRPPVQYRRRFVQDNLSWPVLTACLEGDRHRRGVRRANLSADKIVSDRSKPQGVVMARWSKMLLDSAGKADPISDGGCTRLLFLSSQDE